MTPAARLAAQIAKMERERPDLPTARIVAEARRMLDDD